MFLILFPFKTNIYLEGFAQLKNKNNSLNLLKLDHASLLKGHSSRGE